MQWHTCELSQIISSSALNNNTKVSFICIAN